MGVFDGIALEVIPKAEIAKHLKECVMARGGPDIFQIVVFAAHPHTFLRGGRAFVAALVQPQKNILKLNHARIGEQQGRVVARDK